MNQIKGLKIRDKIIYTLLFAAVGTASLQHGLEAKTVCGRSGGTLLNDKPVAGPSEYWLVASNPATKVWRKTDCVIAN